MTSKIILGVIVAVAFVAGTITTGTVTFAQQPSNPSLDAMVDALNNIAISIQGINPVVNAPAGQACWDTNGNGVPDSPNEDVNGDTVVDVQDCQGLQGEQGQQGIQGIQGEQGVPGPEASVDHYMKTATGLAEVGEFVDVKAECDSLDLVTGGGFSADGGLWNMLNDCPAVGDESDPSCADEFETPDGWRVSAKRLEGGNVLTHLDVYVMCADTSTGIIIGPVP